MQFAPSFDGAADVHVAAINETGDSVELVTRAAKRAKIMTALHESGVVAEADAGKAIADVTQAALRVVPGGISEASLRAAIADAIAPLHNAINDLNTRIGTLERQVASMNTRFTARFSAIDARFDGVDERLDNVNETLAGIRDRVAGLERQQATSKAQLANQQLEAPTEVLELVPNRHGESPAQLAQGITVAQLDAVEIDFVKACLTHYSLSRGGWPEELRLRRQLGVRKQVLL